MMSNYDDLLLDFDYLAEDTIALEPEQIQQAAELSSQIVNRAGQWQAYLSALALYGFEQWLKERAAELPIDLENCSVMQPAIANAIDKGVGNLQVGDFKLCLLATGSSIEDLVVLPRAVIDLPEYTAHFYVAIAVKEELEQATIKGFITYDSLMAQLQSTNLAPEPDWTYQLPLAWFEPDVERLLLYLRCLETSAIELPAIPNNRAIAVAEMQSAIVSVIPQLQSRNFYLWQLFTWEQGALLLTNPELLSWLYRLQTEPELATERDRSLIVEQLSQLLTNFSQQVVNVGLWLQSELEGIAENITWTLLPAPVLVPVAFRSVSDTVSQSPQAELEKIIAELQATEVAVPAEARAAYLNFNLADNPLRLYAVTWSIAAEESLEEEWALLLILGVQSGYQLPQGLQLQISDREHILFEQDVAADTEDTYLYASVIGTLSEQFLVTIALSNRDNIKFNFLFES